MVSAAKKFPPVPLSLQSGRVAYNGEKEDNVFKVFYEQTTFYDIWKTYDKNFNYSEKDTVFIYTSIFAPRFEEISTT